MSALPLLALVASLAAAPIAHADARADTLAQSAGFTQRLGESVPGDLGFRDEAGRDVSLGDFYGDAPIVLVFAWFGCSTLCPTVTANLAHVLAGMGDPASRYRVIVASIDPRDAVADAARMKSRVLREEAAEAPAWHFVTGREDAIAALTRAAGFRYAYDDATHQYAHPAGYVLLTPDGRIARYFAGFDFTSGDLRQALAEAGRREIASPVAQLLLLCFHFTPAGRHSSDVMNALRATSVALLALAAGAFVLRRRAGR